jgi:hypothetical protein
MSVPSYRERFGPTTPWSDLLKWKLVLVAAIGTVGLGLTESEVGHPIVLIGIPLICAYVDLLCRHLTLRIHVIGNFIRSRPEVESATSELDGLQNLYREYEMFAERNRGAFAFESRLNRVRLLASAAPGERSRHIGG